VKCYDLIHQIISSVDQAAQQPDAQGLTGKRKQEAYDVINNSQDEVFQTNLYDWYLAQGWSDRLLDIDSPFVINYLQRKSVEEVARADLLWRYYAHYDDFLEAAKVQLQLAKSAFDLNLEQRIEYLSRARANASTKSLGMANMGRPRQSRQELIREVSDMLDVANIQGDLLQRMKADPRLAADRRPQVIKQLNSQILGLDDLYNGYVDQAGYYDLALVIFQAADHRNAADVRATWQNLLESIHQETEQEDQIQPYEAVSERVRALGIRLSLSESTFPLRKSSLLPRPQNYVNIGPATLIPMLLRYSYEYQRTTAPPTWISDLFLDLSIPHETLVSVLEAMYYNDEVPFKGRNRRYIAAEMVNVITKWYQESAQTGGKLFGSEENALAVGEMLREVVEGGSGLSEEEMDECRILRGRVEMGLRR
jgi:nuclear pore complex protein Nup155